jgi:predicted metal-dependent hydrolase
MATAHGNTALTQTGQNPVSVATVNTIPLNAGEKALVRKDEASKRRAHLKALEEDAQTFVTGYHTAKAINDEATVLHRKFKDVVEEMRPVFERVRDGFAPLHKGETVMGETTGEAWARKHLRKPNLA